MKKVLKFLLQRRLLSLALASLIVALILQVFGQSTIAHWVLGAVSIFEVLPLLYGMLEDIRSGSYGIDILAATAIVSAVLLGQFYAAIVVVIMLTGGEGLEDYAENRAKIELDALLKNAPRTAHLIRNKKTIDVDADQVKAGDKFIVKPGELTPADARIIEGESEFDEASLTGESRPVTKTVAEDILSGSVNISASVTAVAVAAASESQYQQIVKLVQSASDSRSPFVRLADRYSIPFTLSAYAIAISVWVLYGHAIRFLEVIIVATPCPLLLAAPIALISGMSRASKYGIIVKTGSSLEKLAEAQAIAFDKTGTLTKGNFAVSEVHAFKGHDEGEVIKYAAGLEALSNHVIASAIVDYAASMGIKPFKVKQISEASGYGVSTSMKGHHILVGRRVMLEKENVELPASVKKLALDSTATFVSVNNEVIGYIVLADEIRPESEATIKSLETLGLRNILMVTGDNKTVAERVAQRVNIKKIKAEALPAEKLKYISSQKKRPIVFVGDGVNDAPVLTASDVGIAIGARGSTVASESADLVIVPDDIGRVAVAYKIARNTFKIARQSILVGIGLSFVLMAVFATGKFPPLYGAILQEVVDVFVIFNALRAHRQKVVI